MSASQPQHFLQIAASGTAAPQEVPFGSSARSKARHEVREEDLTLPLGWNSTELQPVAAPSFQEDTPDQHPFIEELNRRVLAQAAHLQEQAESVPRQEGYSFAFEARERTLERIVRTLAGVSHFINVAAMAGKVPSGDVFIVERKDRTEGYWSRSKEEEHLDMRRLFETSGRLHGTLPKRQSEMLSAIFVQNLFAYKGGLVGFDCRQASPSRLLFERVPANLEARLDQPADWA